MMFVPRASPPYSPVPRSPAASGGAMRTVTAPIVSVPSPSAWVSYARRRGWPSRISDRAWSTARKSASIAPLPSAEARQWCSPASMITAPRLRALEPDWTVQRARCRVGVSVVGSGMSGLPPGRCGGIVRGAFACGLRREVSLIAPAQLRARLPDRVLERVGQGRRRRRDDVRVAAHRRPRSRTVLRIDDHAGPRGRGGIAIEDAHLVVHEVDVVDRRIERAERLA